MSCMVAGIFPVAFQGVDCYLHDLGPIFVIELYLYNQVFSYCNICFKEVLLILFYFDFYSSTSDSGQCTS